MVTLWLMLGLLLGNLAQAQSPVPERLVPPTVLSEVRLLSNRFESVLLGDCDESRCYSKGCTYLDHVVADRPRSTSLPGLGQDPAPSADGAQPYLTRAECAFTHEGSVSARDAQILAERLQEKLTTGWTVVGVTHQRLRGLPAYLQDPVPEPVEDDEPEDTDVPVQDEPEPAPPPDWSLSLAGQELWSTVLPHTPWMIALVLVTLTAMLLIWSWRRVGRASIEEQMLLAELGRDPGPAAATPVEVQAEGLDDEAFVAEQDEAWRTRLAAMGPDAPDPEVQALVRDLLRGRELDLLAKAVLRFPHTLPAAFPSGAVGGDLAAAKLELAEHLKQVDVDALPDDATFFRRLNRHALSASVASQTDADLVRSLREEFGATGLASLLSQLPPRPAALLFALAPPTVQDELVRLLEPARLAAMAEMLLRSDRMSPAESAHLSEVLTAARSELPVPAAPRDSEVTDRGESFDAAGPLSMLLEAIHPDRRAALFEAALGRSHGSLADWTRGILVSDMLLVLSTEARADLFLELQAEPLAAWLSLLDGESRERLLDGMPAALRSSLRAVSVFPSRAEQLALAEHGRKALARSFQAQIARLGLPFSRVLTAGGPASS